MAITRRDFLKRTGAATAGALVGPSFFSNPLLRSAMATAIGDRYFITFYLDGGNDGLNTVIPVTNGTTGTLRSAYENARSASTSGGLRLTAGELGATGIDADYNTGSDLALHPGFRGLPFTLAGDGGLKALYDAGEVAVIQGCGYPRYSLSHEESRLIWQRGAPFGSGGVGWVGEALDESGYQGTDVPGVNIQNAVAPDFAGTTTSVLAIARLEDFGFPYDENYAQDVFAKRICFNQMQNLALAPAGQQVTLQYVGNSGAVTLISSEQYPQLHSQYNANTSRRAFGNLYGAIGRSSARDLREIAKIIYGVERGVPNVNARFFQLSSGGYDTHSDQGAASPNGQHYQLHGTVAASLKVFRDDLRDMGQQLHSDPDHIWKRTTVLVWSEFSRRIKQNENGTDHGSQGPMFVVGGNLNGGVYGNHPNINQSAWDSQGNSVYHHTGDDHDSTDFRDVYGTILKNWVNLPGATVATMLPIDLVPAGHSPTDYWTTANFDLARPVDGEPLFK